MQWMTVIMHFILLFWKKMQVSKVYLFTWTVIPSWQTFCILGVWWCYWTQGVDIVTPLENNKKVLFKIAKLYQLIIWISARKSDKPCTTLKMAIKWLSYSTHGDITNCIGSCTSATILCWYAPENGLPFAW